VVARRQFLAMSAAIGATAIARRANAVEPAKKLEDVWPAIRAGEFDQAAQRLQLHVTEWPLDRGARADLAVMQFAAEMFDKAEENFGRVVKLRRGVAQSSGPHFDIDYLEAWYRLAQLRASHTPDTPSPVSPHSLLAVLARAEHQAFAAELADAYFAYLDQVEMKIGKTTVTMEDGSTATSVVNINRPDRRAVEQSYLCIGNFMLGEQAIGLDDPAAGKQFLTAAVASEAESEVEYYIAKAELARLAG
jgi:hypothetical protein